MTVKSYSRIDLQRNQTSPSSHSIGRLGFDHLWAQVEVVVLAVAAPPAVAAAAVVAMVAVVETAVAAAVAVVAGPEGQQRRLRPSPGRLSEELPVLMIDPGVLGSRLPALGLFAVRTRQMRRVLEGWTVRNL